MKRHIITAGALILTASLLAGCASAGGTDKNEKKTLDSFSCDAEGIYVIDYYADYKMDEYLAANIKTVEDFDAWMTTNLTHGVPTGDIPEMGCSSFAAVSDGGDHLFGRNYDMYECDALVVRTDPEDGYASIGIADMSHMNLGNGGNYDITDESSRPLLLAAPWCICDGINEKGLGVSLLQLSNEHVAEDTSNGDLLLYVAVRVLLDKCANTGEAIDLLGNYDMYSGKPYSFHVFITDSSGRSVIAEWDEGGLVIVEDDAVTNFLLCSGKSDNDMRYTKIHKKIDGVSALTSEDAMGVLKFVNQGTCWSAVYDLEKFSVDVCFNADYTKVYSYQGSSLT